MLLLCGLTAAAVIIYLYLLHRRLTGPNPWHVTVKAASFSPKELDAATYNDIDMLKAIPPEPTGLGYVVIGGSGFLGSYLVRLLILRGEKYIRIVDVVPPPTDLASHPSVSFIYCDITDHTSVEKALTAPFKGLDAPPTVIHHTASAIRFWERASYLYPISYKVNVIGTQNVIDVAKSIPSAMVLYTGTVDVARPSPRYTLVGFDHHYRNPVPCSDAWTPPASVAVARAYTQSKAAANKLVSDSNGLNGLKTASIRPGWNIMGINDYTTTSALKEDPGFDFNWRSNSVCVWDVAAAHLCLEDALRQRPEEIGGQSFLITGKGQPWSNRQIKEAIQHFSSKPLECKPLPVVVIFLLAHVLERLLWTRHLVLTPIYAIFGAKPSPSPKWLGLMLFLQPATLNFLDDVIIDHSRAEKMIGYKPQWTTEACLKWAVEEMESGRHAGRERTY